MPCQVDTSYEDNKWNKAYHEHHDEIELILEQLLDDQIDLKTAKVRTRSAKQKLATAYGKIFGGAGYNQDAIKKEQARLLGKWA